ncbi:hypothetical protein PCANC_04054 [Puccinia coronata f. sp. avenae]|uniref:CxC1-like cysteine cluster associated with KDZ transposases domain-containing protein n=1 Tax=Puccinia coronata f. sp. avenae TaxID=200324 RepID=A0A2N5W296_9BASI|nr:hypothetical protein PCANC_04054 [Puccinia coronata f. sp. avenae]
MARSHHQDIPQGNRTERLRRYLNALSNADAYAHNTNIEEQDDECDWIEICDEEDPNPIDAVIEARKARHQELAKEHNYSLMLESLHPVYMQLKFKTKDWDGPDALHDFRHCQCLPHTKIARHVDLMDISGQSQTSVKF